MPSKFGKGAVGRDIIDDTVSKNSYLNHELYSQAKSNPAYFGQVSIGEEQVTLSAIKGRANTQKSFIICDIINGTESMNLNDGPAEIRILSDGRVISEKTHPAIIKYIKSCIVCSYSPSSDFTEIVSAFATTLIEDASNLTIPLNVFCKNNIQKIILKELNDYLKELCDKNWISYTIRSGSKIDRMLQSAEK